MAEWHDGLEKLVAEEWPDGRSPEAAARELCRSLGVAGIAPTLQRLLTDMIGRANFAAHDRNLILSDFAEAAPDAAQAAKAASFERWNPQINAVSH